MRVSNGDVGVRWMGGDQQWRHGCVLDVWQQWRHIYQDRRGASADAQIQKSKKNCTNALKCRESLQSRGQNWQKQVLIRRFDPKILKTDMLGFSQHSRGKSMTKRF